MFFESAFVGTTQLGLPLVAIQLRGAWVPYPPCGLHFNRVWESG